MYAAYLEQALNLLSAEAGGKFDFLTAKDRRRKLKQEFERIKNNNG